MRELDVVSFSVSLIDELSKLKGLLFKVVKHNNKYYISKFDNVIISEINPINLNNDAIDYLENIPNNYSYITTIDRRNHFAMIESKRIFGIKDGIEKLHIFYEEELPDSVCLYETVDGKNAIVAYTHIYDKSNSAFLIESKHRNKAYAINSKIEYDSNDNHKEQNLLVLESKEKNIRIDNYQMFLLVGDISFTDTKEYVSEMDRLSLYHIQADVQNYLNLWKEYNRIELEREYYRFKKALYFKFDSITYGDDIKLYFNDEEFKKINIFKDSMCFVGNSALLSLFNSNDLDSYNKIEKELLSNDEMTVIEINVNNINHTEKSLRIKTTDRNFFRNLKSGFICLSLLGNKISYQRREKAKERIITGKAGIQKMYTWFTDNPEPNDKPEVIEINSTLLPNNNLTQNQIEAISVILNTPDFVIIVGPPGTGKTTVIKAALIQLNALTGNKYNFGNNLLSGFRHETVLNLTENIDLFGLPAVKVGDSSKNSNSEELEPRIVKFINDLIDALKEKYIDLTASDDEYIEFKKKYFNYISFNNSIDSSIDILNGISKLDVFVGNVEVNDKIDKIIKSLKQQTNKLSFEEESFLNFLYGLPMNLEAYNDDKDRIDIELFIFEDYKNLKDDVKKLNKVLNNKNFSSEELKSLRRDLILKYRKQPEILTSPNKKQEIVDFLNQLFDIIKCERLKKFDGDKIAILDYIDSLTENPFLIRDTLLAYTKVLGATNQQTISKNMYLIKNDDVLFDNVFIDEAATSSPLDLFIPMSVAKKKIILVGDHKQLPNITDEDIIDEVKESVNKNSDDAEDTDISQTMKKTLFEILIEKAHQLEAKDGIKRVITLDTQFRMHPKLGEIVSNSFYDGIIKSIRPESDFAHNYHNLNNKYLYWLDTPYDNNEKYRENKNSTSRWNIPEARRIAKHIKEAIDDKNYKPLSIGVITMYRDQVKAIKEELRKIGVFDDKYDNMPSYESQEILIGTVDAFQGREFDIVYLSLVYVFNEDKNYSRLAKENSKSLLCVALSRQKRMLIVVGDMSVYNIPKAKEKVKPLYDLAMLCSGGENHE